MNCIHKFKEWLSDDSNWEKVERSELERPDFKRPSNREHSKARNLLKKIKNNNCDVNSYECLDLETQNFLRYLLILEIESVRYLVRQLECIQVESSTFERLTRRKKREAIKCWKFLEMIKNEI